MRTEVLDAGEPATISRAVQLLRAGETVALPTETVYGLAADALNPSAVAKIFAAKQRPKFNPLIVHLPARDWLDRIATIAASERRMVERLTDRFWPGPLTILVPRSPLVPDITTAGLITVAVRMSEHPAFSAICAGLDRPLAAPSANRFGHVSPTTAQHVLSELEDRIPLIVDAGPPKHGVESTIVSLRGGGIDILRSGPVTRKELEEFGKVNRARLPEKIIAPGMLPTHYAPLTPLRLVSELSKYAPAKGKQVGLLAWRSVKNAKGFAEVRCLSEKADMREAATNLFRYLRELDALKLDLIVAEQVPEEGLGVAIMDRLRRAAAA